MPIGRVRKVFKEYCKDNNKDLRFSNRAAILLAEMLSKFEINVLNLAATEVIARNEKTIQEKDIIDTLNSRVSGPKLVPVIALETPNKQQNEVISEQLI
jgi:histone H3/H4